MTLPLAVVFAVRDEEEQLPGALASVAGWPAEVVVVVDPRTADRTREVAAAAGALVAEHAFEGLGAQWSFGLSRCHEAWALVLDADERVTRELRDSIENAVREGRHPAYEVRRRNLVLGRPQRFGDWGGDRLVRLVRRAAVRIAGGGVHPHFEAASKGRLDGVLEHDTLRSLSQYLPKVHDYAVRSAGALRASGRRSSCWEALARAEWRFLRGYFLRGGFLDGARGLLVAVLAAHGTFLKWAMVWGGSTGRR